VDVDPPGLLPSGSDVAGSRRRVLEAALALFAERGYAGASIRDIADGAGIRSASLYDLYPSKAHILAAVVTIGHETFLAALRAAVEAAGDDPAERVRALVRADVLSHATFPTLAIVTNTELGRLPDDLRREPQRLRDEAALLALDVAMDGAARGVFDIPHPGPTLAALGSMCLRVPHWFTPSSDYPASQLADDYAELALRVLDHRSAPDAHQDRG
jgi:AcrR family transcriptional regulator